MSGDDHDQGAVRGDGDDNAASEWQTIDTNLRAIASKRSALDAEEARWLRDAERVELHRIMGFGSMAGYLEHVLGYTPHVALDRMRVARELESLPLMTEALASNQLCYTALRELTRVATPETERVWREAAIDKTVGEITSMVAGRSRGDLPNDAPDPAIVPTFLRLDILPEHLARFREVCAVMDERAGRRHSDGEMLAALCEAYLAAASTGSDADSDDDKLEGRARYQVALTVCASCKRGTQDGGGITVPVKPSTVARAECDAQRIGSIDPQTGAPARAKQDVPPATQRFVRRRDNGHCQTPGCRAGRFLELHHILALADGGSHDPSNLVLLCDGCHTAIHEGTLTLTGSAPDSLKFTRPNLHAASAIAPSRFDRAVRREELKKILVTSGFKRHEAAKAVDVALAAAGADSSLEACVREAFRACRAFVSAQS